VLPVIEILVLVIGALLPLVLKDYLTVYATRVLILCLFALSFDLVWGYAGIMSFGQAVFFGTAGYGVALLARDLGVTSILLVLPAGLLIGLAFALLLGGFLLLGRHPSSVILFRWARSPALTRRIAWRGAGIISAARTAFHRSRRCRSAVTISRRGRSIII